MIWMMTPSCQLPHHPPSFFNVCVFVCVCACVCVHECLHIQWGQKSTAKNLSSFIKLIQVFRPVIVLRCCYITFQQKFVGTVFTESLNLVFPPFALITACTLSGIKCFAEFER